MNARYYNSDIGRFISQDPVYLAVGSNQELKERTQLELHEYLADPQNLNGYSYVKNNPLVAVDPSGEWVQYIIGNSNAVKLGNWANNLYNNNSVAKYAMDHPLKAGAIAGVAGGAVAAGGIVAAGGSITCGVLCGGGAVTVATTAGPAASLIGPQADKISRAGSSAQTLAVRGPQVINFSNHALKRMLVDRGVSVDQAKNVVQNSQPFQYFHNGLLKTGYYNQANKIFVGEISGTGKITTVITNASQKYINNLKGTIK